ncbi:class I SAM-dependent methyltransferase [Alphaproteobacteria bacterium]|jgi:ubiquinone/menaquinone biosynthesis C-methylase UbiE|nr:class I SAM-dependent methyltransferase [Alphaproteobacteria bacterium]
MGLYEKYVLPRFLDTACGTKPILKQREKVVPHCTGRVLEVGMGTGLNLPFYDPSKIDCVIGLEPAPEMVKRAKPVADAMPFPVEFIDLPGEEIPLEDNSVDTVLLTYTLCTIPGAEQALAGMRRVLKPGGQLLFCEHGKAPDVAIHKWQNRLNGGWKVLAGGCNMNRDIPNLISDSGFKITDMTSMYLPSTPRVLGFNYWGHAKKN